MGGLGNKAIMAKNIQRYMDMKGVTRTDVCDALGIKYTTFTDWVKGNTYPRIDKIELMANYFGISKSDLVEEHTLDQDEEPSYYTNPETAKLAQEAFDDPDTRILLDAKKDLDPDDLKMVIDMVKRLKGNND